MSIQEENTSKFKNKMMVTQNALELQRIIVPISEHPYKKFTPPSPKFSKNEGGRKLKDIFFCSLNVPLKFFSKKKEDKLIVVLY